MRHVLLHALYLLRRPAVLLVLLLVAAGGTLATWLPAFQTPGFELSLLLTIAIGLLGGLVGIASGRQEGRLLQGHGDRPSGVTRLDSALASTWRATLASFSVLVLALLIPLLTAIVRSLATTACNPFDLIGFFPLLTLPSALLASAAGVLLGLAFRRIWLAVLGWVLLLILGGVVTAWPLIAGPQVFAFNHLLGYLPGPLYDEALAVSAPLWWFRLQTVLLVVAFVALAAGLLDTVAGRLGRPRVRPATWFLFAAAVAGVVALQQRAPELGLVMTDAALREALGGERESPHFRLIDPRGMPREEVERVLRDAEFRHLQLAPLLAGPEVPAQRTTIWLYRSDQEKARLVGAGNTQFAKPWRHELHLNAHDFPHPTLKHELAHVLAAPSGAPPFGVTARLFGLWPQMGLIEGMAVAADAPVTGELTLHQWAAGMRRQKLAPDMRQILGPEGFYAAAPGRAYTLAGSFLRHLGDVHGAEKLRALYRHGDFQGTYGRSLDALVTEWEKHLDGLPLEPAVLDRAFARFREGALFTRTCGREVARLQEEARLTSRSDPEEALRLVQRAGILQPEEPAFALAEARLLRGSGSPPGRRSGAHRTGRAGEGDARPGGAGVPGEGGPRARHGQADRGGDPPGGGDRQRALTGAGAHRAGEADRPGQRRRPPRDHPLLRGLPRGSPPVAAGAGAGAHPRRRRAALPAGPSADPGRRPARCPPPPQPGPLPGTAGGPPPGGASPGPGGALPRGRLRWGPGRLRHPARPR